MSSVIEYPVKGQSALYYVAFIASSLRDDGTKESSVGGGDESGADGSLESRVENFVARVVRAGGCDGAGVWGQPQGVGDGELAEVVVECVGGGSGGHGSVGLVGQEVGEVGGGACGGSAVGSGGEGVRDEQRWSGSRLGPRGGLSYGRGANYERNQAARERKRSERFAKRSVSSGGIVGSERSVGGGERVVARSVVGGDRVSLRESFDVKREMENKLAARRAELALERLNDVGYSEAHRDMCKKQLIAKTNAALEKSEKSLSGLETVSPGSSASQHDIRMQAKELADVQSRLALFESVVEKKADGDFKEELRACLARVTTEELEGFCPEMGYGSDGRSSFYNRSFDQGVVRPVQVY